MGFILLEQINIHKDIQSRTTVLLTPQDYTV